MFARLYNVRELLNRMGCSSNRCSPQLLISIEKEIEDSLPQFQELILSLKFVSYYSSLVLLI